MQQILIGGALELQLVATAPGPIRSNFRLEVDGKQFGIIDSKCFFVARLYARGHLNYQA